ncbi:hypothetical protein PLICRDRAFT_80112, partial [Plicaturopsis crispa FD-325 SS-3]
MSCILYNIAIEPLGNMLRASNIKGIQVPDLAKRILVTMFADDTLVYLSERDDFRDLEKIIDLFCLASTAKFNTEKQSTYP